MKVVELPEFGIENLRIHEAEVPVPGAGQVLVRLGAASVNYRDYQIVIGEFAPDHPLPIIPCSDGAGKIVSVGEGVRDLAQGDRVAPLFFPEWMSGEALGDERSVTFGLEAPGVLSTYGVYQEHQVARVPGHLSDEEASCFPCAGLTAWNCLVSFSNIGTGDTVLVQGTGGVAMFALQFARAMDSEVIVTSGSDSKLERAKALGANHCINYRTTPAWGAAARELTGGTGVDAVVEIGGEGTLAESFAAIRRGGHINIVGYLAGIGLGLSVFHLIERNANLHGLSVGNREQFEAMMAFVEEHRIRPVIDRRYVLEEAGQAISDIAKGDHFGKLVVNLASA
jgi:NADPH:quinone reductase-like Zn-dependent oxidoreductase